MKKIIAIIVLFLVFVGSNSNLRYSEGTEVGEIEEVDEINIRADHLGLGFFNNNITQKIWIFLPEDYNLHENWNYPVIYLSPGYDFDVLAAIPALDYIYYTQHYTDAITVIVNANLGSLGFVPFINSDMLGYWEDFLVYDVIPYIDENYRTIAESSARAFVTHDFFSTVFTHLGIFDTVYGYNMNINNPNGSNLLFHEQLNIKNRVLTLQEEFLQDCEGIYSELEAKNIYLENLGQFEPSPQMDIHEAITSLLLIEGLIIFPNLSKWGFYMDFPYEFNGSEYMEIPEIKRYWDYGLIDVNASISNNTSVLNELNMGIAYSNTLMPEIACWGDGNSYLCEILTTKDISYQKDIVDATTSNRVLMSDQVYVFCSNQLSSIDKQDGMLNPEVSIPGFPLLNILIGLICAIGLIEKNYKQKSKIILS